MQSDLSIDEGQLDWKEAISVLWNLDSFLSCVLSVNQFTVHELPSSEAAFRMSRQVHDLDSLVFFSFCTNSP